VQKYVAFLFSVILKTIVISLPLLQNLTVRNLVSIYAYTFLLNLLRQSSIF